MAVLYAFVGCQEGSDADPDRRLAKRYGGILDLLKRVIATQNRFPPRIAGESGSELAYPLARSTTADCLL